MSEIPFPSFLMDMDVDKIHSEMLNMLPENMDKSQGQHAWNLTRPTALITAQLCQQVLPNALRLIFPLYADGEWLDCHAEMKGIVRHAATASAGILSLVVKPPLDIPAGTEFATASADGKPSVSFRTTEDHRAETENFSVPVKCTQIGLVGNVPPHTVVFKITPLDGILSVDNPEAMTGGTETENDESLRTRVVEYDRSRDTSRVGSIADYRRWALEVDGVGGVTVIPTPDDSGLVTAVITDSNGGPANNALCQAVYNHIMAPDSPFERLTAPNARLKVEPPETVTLNLSAEIELNAAAAIDTVKMLFIADAQKYLAAARTDGEIRVTQLGKILAGTEGVYDYRNLTVNGEAENIPLTATQLPQISRDTVRFTEVDDL